MEEPDLGGAKDFQSYSFESLVYACGENPTPLAESPWNAIRSVNVFVNLVIGYETVFIGGSRLNAQAQYFREAEKGTSR